MCDRNSILLCVVVDAEPGCVPILHKSQAARLKNVNATNTHVWRYHHYLSNIDYATKRATLLSTLKKADRMANDVDERLQSAQDKCSEFLRLGYPPGILRYMCAVVARDTGHGEWMRVRKWIDWVSSTTR